MIYFLAILLTSLLVASFPVFIILKSDQSSCSEAVATNILRWVFNTARQKAVENGSAEIEFKGKKAVITSGGKRWETEISPLYVDLPSVSKKACSNRKGKPKLKNKFRFSHRGLSDISGTLYVRCGKKYMAVSVIAPLGATKICRLEGGEWKNYGF